MIYVFDLDGTLCETQGRDYGGALPRQGRIDAVNTLYRAGHTIVIDTARGSLTGDDWHARTVTQLKAWGVHYHTLRTGQKAFGDVYVDDHGVRDTDFFV